MGRLRRRATIARKGIIQILETAQEYGFEGEEWQHSAREMTALARALRAWSGPTRWRWASRALSAGSSAARERLEKLC